MRSLLARGDKVIATARNNAHERLATLKDLGAAVLNLDVTASQADLNTTIAVAIEIHGGIDVLVNSAGYIEAGLVEETRSVMLDSDERMKY